uniref:Uncharacterized protein n=1 Tax=Chromera velia CCMP2878 TaxID=1169474 RepID=A0A0G4FLV2_9ALVE|eukprot:Cvel_17644.t1-p1 / transcript=Cvel_17644.t1 / gene=Cvel_17644 / organism=Chromera_velia_CCMP2878 / gene_product=Putative ankyrin repeat protein RF_0381, putative / transcript_product=Putative ankyrin repeat protein RF_0381, putative / location=Cvel_scaffold1421:7107-8999(+) / protein_length=631 / sequence_SO=supercontig / SO=protein_coding / is_pseudo=false
MERSSSALSSVKRELEVLAVSLLGVIGSIRQIGKVVGNTCHHFQKNLRGSPSTSPVSNAICPVLSSAPALSDLWQLVERVHVVLQTELQYLTSVYGRSVCTPLFEDEGTLLRSFHPSVERVWGYRWPVSFNLSYPSVYTCITRAGRMEAIPSVPLELEAVAKSLLRAVRTIRNVEKVIASIEFVQQREGICPESSIRSRRLAEPRPNFPIQFYPAPENPKQDASVMVLVAFTRLMHSLTMFHLPYLSVYLAVSTLRQSIGLMKPFFQRGLNRVMNTHYQLDLTKVLPRNVGKVIRSFQPITFYNAFEMLMQKHGKERDLDTSTLKKVGARLDHLVDAETPYGVKTKRTVLMKAVLSRELEAVTLFVENGAEVNVKSPSGISALQYAYLTGESGIANFLLSRGAEKDEEADKQAKSVFVAAENGNDEFVDLFLSYGFDPNGKNQNGDTSLHCAVKKGRRKSAEILLNHGARVNERATGDQAGFTPLFHTVVAAGRAIDHGEMTEVLISRGADLNMKLQDHASPKILLTAALYGAVNVVQVLLNNKADLRATDDSRRTALHMCAFFDDRFAQFGVDVQKKVRVAQLLIAKGINVNAVDRTGRTATDIALSELPQTSPLFAFFQALPGPAQAGQ